MNKEEINRHMEDFEHRMNEPFRKLEENLKQKDMKEEEKYFIPSIEDIGVGYEYEVQDENGFHEEKWQKNKIEIRENADPITKGINIGSNISGFVYNYYKERIRVPYLTKEQIEAEGWRSEDTSGMFSKGIYKLGYTSGVVKIDGREDFIVTGLIIFTENYSSVDCNVAPEIYKAISYRGPCKDINTFRYICKLLNIK